MIAIPLTYQGSQLLGPLIFLEGLFEVIVIEVPGCSAL